MPAAAEQPTKRSPVQIKADQLFQGQQEILIEHKGETYQLRITRNDKLILTK
jgi:hemin uptake protein HemP